MGKRNYFFAKIIVYYYFQNCNSFYQKPIQIFQLFGEFTLTTCGRPQVAPTIW